MKFVVTGGVLLVATLTIIVAVSAQCPTIRNCETCTKDQPPKCLKCQAPLYAVDETTGRCKACQELDGCWVCNTTKLCSKCLRASTDGPDYNNLGTCSACAPNCRSCSKGGSGTCDTCKAGFCLERNKTCSSCPENCEICVPDPIDSFNCKLCIKGFGKETGTGKCLRCADNCERCSVSGKCDRCKPGYNVNVNKQCEVKPCGKFGNCSFCLNEECKECRDGTVPVNGKCGDVQNT